MLPRLLLNTLLSATIVATMFGAASASSPSTSAASRVASSLNAQNSRRDSVGLYTEAQAERGQAVFKAVCSECHELPDFTGADFRLSWDGTSLYELFENIRTTMPDENPGTLERQQYVDVVTYLLKLNALPAGPTEFTGDSASASASVLRLPPKAR